MPRLNRREFLSRTGQAASAAVLLGSRAGTEAAPAKLPQRLLGRTEVRVPIVGLGTAPMADLPQEEFTRVADAALNAGITYVDTAPNYGPAQAKLGPVVARRRKEMFLVTKVEEPTRDGALRQVEQNLKELRTDRIDLVHMHSFGDADVEQWLGKQGMLEGLRQARERGLIRFIGVSGHHRPARFLPALRTGEIDVLMAAINYVDRFTYGFEEKVLPVAREQKMGIVAMKVLGGAAGFRYHPPAPGLLSGSSYRSAFRYALSQPGVACALIGVKDLDEMRQAAREAAAYRPLTRTELSALADTGRTLSRTWGPHFGPAD